MNAQFKKGVVEMCILKLVSDHDMYGLEVIEGISEEIDVNENTVYPILRRLTVAGYFDTYKEKNVSGPDRKYYRVTEKGIIYLNALLDEYHDFTSKVERIIGG
ncbi:MAG: PadR family transcriptional regulator [Bacillota bacterium]